MIPLRDTTKSPGFPYVNAALIALNALIFLYEFALGEGMTTFIIRYGLIPVNVFSSSSNITITERLYPFLTSMFIHAGWLHLIGNMLFLYIFGDNVEGRMGHFKYLIFYIVCGIAAASFQFITNTHSVIPMIGASGAISGVLGAYITFYPRSKILTLVPIFFLIQLVNIPASVFIIIWFLIQFMSGLGTLNLPRETGGVAFWAHIGGFVSGLVLARFFDRRRYLMGTTTERYFR
jgi:membrane associated rhomboid family serine protease